jgi:hypothetical protein
VKPEDIFWNDPPGKGTLATVLDWVEYVGRLLNPYVKFDVALNGHGSMDTSDVVIERRDDEPA